MFVVAVVVVASAREVGISWNNQQESQKKNQLGESPRPRECEKELPQR